MEDWRQQLIQAGAEIMDAMPDGSYRARLARERVGPVNDLPFVLSVRWDAPPPRIPGFGGVAAFGMVDEAGPGELNIYDVRLHDPADVQNIVDWLKSKGVEVIGSGTRKIRFRAHEGAAVLNDLQQRPEAGPVTPYVEPELYNNFARRLLGVDSADPAHPRTQLTEDGAGQIVAVADTGIDREHPDFHDRFAGIVALGRAGDASDPDGHGTHVAGSVLGDGTASKGEIKGIAPGAKLFFQSLLDAKGKLGGLPVNLNDLFEQAYTAGARIHNNSWGAKTPSSYTVDSEEVDEYIYTRRDMLVVISAGNAGVSGAAPQKADPGFVDWLSIGAPGSCKNALTVGASRSDRTDGAFGQSKWVDKWPNTFPAPPISQKLVSGDPECLAAFSSRGPTDDRRIKPDLVAPGTDILSTRSSQAPDGNYWGPFEPMPKFYAFDGGTSMAAPLVSGCAALVRQYYVQTRGHQRPSAALIKATLVNSTKWLAGEDSNAKSVGKPNYHQGHGRVSLDAAYPNASRPGMGLSFVDEWETFQFTRTGQRKRYQFVLPADIPELRICMAYTDAPARGLQNNVNLVLQYLDEAKKFMGNEELPDQLTLPDPDNNLESIRVQNAKKGTWLIQVFVSNLLKPPQDFALVVTGIGLPWLTEI
jgi:serine protease AprX